MVTQCYLSRFLAVCRRLIHYVTPTRWSESNKKEFMEQIAYLFRLTHDKWDIDRYLPMFLACDGNRSWKKDEWNNLYAWADNYAKRWELTVSSPDYWRQKRSEALMKISCGR